MGLGLAAALPALHGYVVRKDESGQLVNKWQASPLVMQVKLPATANLIDGGSQRSSVLAAMQVWNAQLGTLQFVGQASAPGDYEVGNEVNEIVTDSDFDGDAFPAGVLAVTFAYGGGNDYVEADIIFNSAYTWNSYRGSMRSGVEDIQRVAIHELGHALGLDHPDEAGQSVTAIMNSRRSAIDRLQGDDIAGGQFLYGAPGVIPVNDAFASATALTLNSDEAQVTGSNIGATREAGEKGHAGATSVHSVWWKWTATGNGSVTMDTAGSNFDTVLAVYTGAGVSALTEIASNDDEESLEDNPTPQRKRTSKVEFDAVSGTTYHIAVDGWGDEEHVRSGFTGEIRLEVEFALNIAPTFTLQPSTRTVPAGTIAEFSVLAEGRPQPSYRWQRRDPNGTWSDVPEGDIYSGTETTTLWVKTRLSMEGDQFRCLAVSTAGTKISDVATLRVLPILLPAITREPQDTVLHVGYQGMLFVRADLADSFQWYRNDVLLPGQNGETLFFPHPQASDVGRYRVVVSNPGGSVTTRTVEVKVVPVRPISSIQATQRGVLAMRADGSRWSAGAMKWALVPEGDTGLIGAAAGTAHTLLIHGDRTLWAFGPNLHGEVGDGTTQERVAPTKIASDVVGVAAGHSTSYFITSDGTLWAAGLNESGQLGDGTTLDRAKPVKVAKSVRSVTASQSFALFIKTDGTLWGMGSNRSGQLGAITAETNRQTPVKLAEGVVATGAGPASTFFVKSDGTLWAMGRNSSGQLGDGTKTDRSSPVLIMRDAAAVSGGFEHTLFLKKDGRLFAAGRLNQQFESVTPEVRSPTVVAQDVVTMAAGEDCSYYLRTDGVIWGTGVNGVGQLGAGYYSAYESKPVPMAGMFPQPIPAVSRQVKADAGTVTLTAATSATPEPDFNWRRNGVYLPEATGATLTISRIAPSDTGLYTVQARSGSAVAESAVEIVGISTSAKVVGEGEEQVPADILHPNGNIFDQVLLTGEAAAITADWRSGQITRTSFVDQSGDIVQVEFSGPGTLSLVLAGASGPARPQFYYQDVNYMRGHAGIVITGADERTNVAVFSVGRVTAYDPTGRFNFLQPISATNRPANNGNPIFAGHADTPYDGVADLAFIAISSVNGKFGGVRTSNANYFAESGLTGVYAPGVTFLGPVLVGEITAFGAATPVLVLGGAGDVRIAGGSLQQPNRKAVRVEGIARLKFTDGTDSHGNLLPAQTSAAVLEQDGVDITAQVVVNPEP